MPTAGQYSGLDVSIQADDDGFALDGGGGGLVAMGTGDDQGFPAAAGRWFLEFDFDGQGVAFDGGFHSVLPFERGA